MKLRSSGLKAWPVVGIVLMQGIFLLAHWFIYRTVIVFFAPLSPEVILVLRSSLLILAFSFTVTALLNFWVSNPLVTLAYGIGAVWLGFLNYFFFAACLSWLAWLAVLLGFQHGYPYHHRDLVASVFFIPAVLAGVYGLLNALWIRTRRVTIQLPNLPPSWSNRTALLISDLHLGTVNGPAFSRLIATMAARLRPDIVFIPGDFFDGAKTDPDKLAAPFLQLSPPLGIYFVSGNHDEYGNLPLYTEALTRAGIRVLSNERVTVDGLHIVGVPYSGSSYLALRSFLESLKLSSAEPSILLNHVPSRLPVVEQTGVSLQLSGHTHKGQIFPFTWFVRRAFGRFSYGLQRFGSLQIYTSSGAGTWGPPMRVGTYSEIVLLKFV